LVFEKVTPAPAKNNNLSSNLKEMVDRYGYAKAKNEKKDMNMMAIARDVVQNKISKSNFSQLAYFESPTSSSKFDMKFKKQVC
jgi:hypothetical protein